MDRRRVHEDTLLLIDITDVRKLYARTMGDRGSDPVHQAELSSK